MIRYGQQHITEDDIESVVHVLKSVNLTQGPCIPSFENAISELTSVEYAVAVNSATSALHISCLALGLGAGDILWTTPNSFVASANCALYCGAEVDFVDIDPITYNLCPRALEEKLIEAARLNRLPKIVVPVHFAGQSCDMSAIHALRDRYGFRVIEDASHAIGGSYKGEPIGNCRYSDICIFSFHPVKIITTGEGGIALTNNHNIAKKLNLFRSHGITRDFDSMSKVSDGPWYYEQIELGYNYRLTDIQAALGLSQLKRLQEYVLARHGIAERYDSLLKELPVTVPWQHPDSYSSFHLYVIRLQLHKLNTTHLAVFEALREKEIMVNLHYIPIHTQPYYLQRGFSVGDYPESERFYREAISIPIHPSLTQSEQEYVVSTLSNALLK